MSKRYRKTIDTTEIPKSTFEQALANTEAMGEDNPGLEKLHVASIRGIDHYAVARRAHELWESEGCPRGRSEDHWYQAERELLEQAPGLRALSDRSSDRGESAQK